MLRHFITAALVLTVCAPAFGQISTAEAMARLKEKQAARDAARNKPVTITQGELDDMKAEINRLKAELAALQAKATPAVTPTTVPVPRSLAVGLSRAEVLRFIQVRHETYQLKTDDAAPNAGGKGVMVITELAKHRVFDGSFGFNGQTHFANYREMLRPDTEYTLVMAGDKVSAVQPRKIIVSAPEEVAPIWRGR